MDCLNSSDFDERGKIYHHKDLTKYNRDLSKVVIVDNSPLAFKSLEPNAILIKDFYGRDTADSELDSVLELTDQIMDIEMEHEDDDSVYVDYRYIMAGISRHSADISPDLATFNRQSPDDILESTQRFLFDLKESLMQNGKLPTSLKFGEPKEDEINVTNRSDRISDDGTVCMETDDELSRQSLSTSLTPSSYSISLKRKDIFDAVSITKNIEPSVSPSSPPPPLEDAESVSTSASSVSNDYDGIGSKVDDSSEECTAEIKEHGLAGYRSGVRLRSDGITAHSQSRSPRNHRRVNSKLLAGASQRDLSRRCWRGRRFSMKPKPDEARIAQFRSREFVKVCCL